ncbi:MAG: caspase family protein [Ignavibacteriales bacterium]|nr:caspase family protein [Ignavibacteriales bacterium]
MNWLKIKGPSSSLKPDTYDYFQDGYINNYSIGISYDLFYSENENVISDISYVVSGFKSEDSVNKEIEKFNKTTLVKYPPNTLVSLSLSEASKTGYLEASKQGNIFLKLANKGKGGAYALSVKFSPVKINGLTYPSEKNIGDILPNETKEISIPISASLDVESKEVSLTLTFSESNGFPPPPSKITFSTKAFVPPKLEIADVGIEDANGNGKIDVGEIVKVTARIQNTGAGKADDVSATVTIGENIFLTPDSKTSFPLVKLESGEHKDISFSIFANQNAASVPVFVSLTEKHNKFGVSKFPLPLELNKTIPKLQEIVVQGKSEEESLRPVGKTFERASGLSIDIEQNIPETKQKNPNAVALIIAVAEYANKNVPKVEYAKRDAQFIREYLVKTFGYDAKNILPQNADEVFTFATMKTYIKRTLPSYLKKDGSSEVFIYYTGHGAPSTITSEAFFVPQDCDPNFVSDDNAYNMNDFYMDIAKLNAKKKFVVVDACFSGQTGSGQTLVKNASPALLKVKNVLLASENSVLFQSSSAEQVSNWYPEKKHSMFTYFFLKGIQGSADKNNDGTITAEELENFVNDENDGLPYFSNREFQRPQKAVVSGKLESVVVKLK